MKTIIVSMDFSEEAENALEYAGALAKKDGAKIVLFNSFAIPFHASNSWLPASSISKLEKYNRQLLEKRAKKLTKKYQVKVIVESGFLKDVELGLEELFFKYKADLVVMGMATKSIEQDIFGNTTTSAILMLKYPVLAVPVNVHYKEIDKILFACDELKEIELSVLAKIKGFTQDLKADLEVFHVENPTGGHRENEVPVVREISEFNGINYSYKSIKSENVIEAIKEEIEKTEAALLIMVPQRYGFWESMVHRSKTRMMASGLSIPLLSIPQYGNL